MYQQTLHSMTAFVKAMTELVRAPRGDKATAANISNAITSLIASDRYLNNPEFVTACNELSAAATMPIEQSKTVVTTAGTVTKPAAVVAPAKVAVKTGAHSGVHTQVPSGTGTDLTAKESGLV
jgi:hypothetical protein